MLMIDGLECSKFDREVFQELQAGGLAAVTVTCGIWGSLEESLDAIAKWMDSLRDNCDLVEIARSGDDIATVYDSGRTAIILGFQNSSAIQGRIRYIQLLAQLGIRVMQLTYNNQNDIGSSCYENADSGLSRFGEKVVTEMNRVGMLIDLSHVGEQTTLDTIRVSRSPVAITHANPSSFFPHKRNKSDSTLRALAAEGGVLGLATYRNITGGAEGISLSHWCSMVEHAVEIVGIDHVGIGTDLGRKVGPADLEWMRMGHWSREVDHGAGSKAVPGKLPPQDWLLTTEQFPGIAEGLSDYGFTDSEVTKIMGRNWMRLYKEVL